MGSSEDRRLQAMLHPVLEEQVLLRLPNDDLTEKIRNAIKDGDKSFLELRLSAGENGEFGHEHTVDLFGKQYRAVLLNLPCLVESHKTFDFKMLFKSADICQVLVVLEDDDPWPPFTLLDDGLTPPTVGIREKFHYDVERAKEVSIIDFKDAEEELLMTLREKRIVNEVCEIDSSGVERVVFRYYDQSMGDDDKIQESDVSAVDLQTQMEMPAAWRATAPVSRLMSPLAPGTPIAQKEIAKEDLVQLGADLRARLQQEDGLESDKESTEGTEGRESVGAVEEAAEEGVETKEETIEGNVREGVVEGSDAGAVAAAKEVVAPIEGEIHTRPAVAVEALVQSPSVAAQESTEPELKPTEPMVEKSMDPALLAQIERVKKEISKQEQRVSNLEQQRARAANATVLDRLRILIEKETKKLNDARALLEQLLI